MFDKRIRMAKGWRSCILNSLFKGTDKWAATEGEISPFRCAFMTLSNFARKYFLALWSVFEVAAHGIFRRFGRGSQKKVQKLIML